MKEEIVSQDVAVEGELERSCGTFEPLEKVGPAKTLEPFSSARQIVEDACLRVGQGRKLLLEIKCEAVAGEMKPVDNLHGLLPEKPGAGIGNVRRV